MAFQYNKLDPSRNEIRLIRFLRNDKNPLEISLDTFPDDENPGYHCLSYVWGDPTLSWPVIIDGFQVLVTQSLGVALQQLAKDQDGELLWADALCINQKDEVEKAHQVRMMYRIYSNAAGVLAWLGPEMDSSGQVMDEISRIGGILIWNLLNTNVPKGYEDNLIAAIGMNHDKIFLMLRWINCLTDGYWTAQKGPPGFWEEIRWEHSEHRLPINAWSAFFSVPYWRRLWISQELATSRSCYILCDTRKESLFLLLAISKRLDAIYLVPLGHGVNEWAREFQNLMNGAPILSCLEHFIGDTRKAKKDILELLKDWGTMGATIPQDRVFALSALTADDLGIDINYSKSLQDHLEDLMRNIFIRNGFQLELFDLNVSSWAAGSPSWVAYYYRGLTISTLASIKIIYFYIDHREHHAPGVAEAMQDFMACGQAAFVIFPVNFPRPGILKLQCQLLGRVHRHQCLEQSDEERDQYENLLNRKFKSQIFADTETSDTHSLATRAWPIAVSVLQKLASFLGGPDNLKLLDLSPGALQQDDGNTNKLSLQIYSLLLHQNQNANQVSPDIYEKYEDAFRQGFLLLCTCSEMLMSFMGEDAEPDEVEDAELDEVDDAEIWDTAYTLAKNSMFFVTFMRTMSQDRSVFTTTNNYIGIGPDTVENGDCVVILPGVAIPYIARQVGSDQYRLIGDAYVPGVMYGEFFEQPELPASQWMEFC